MAEKPICPICGAPTRVYMGNARKDKLCAKHADELKSGKIIMCDKCGEWHFQESPCKCMTVEEYTELPTEGFEKCLICGVTTSGYAFCRSCWGNYTKVEMLDMLNGKTLLPAKDTENNKDTNIYNAGAAAEVVSSVSPQAESPYLNQEDNKVIAINESNKSKCITCGKSAEGLLFCTSCYYKYKDKELLFKITNCSNVELLDADYEGRYTCKDGHIVKSKSERDIDNYLFENGIPHAYEKELPYGAGIKDTLHPDFYLPHYLGKGRHVYVEHWGYNENNIQYTKTKKFKMPIYQNLCESKAITLVCTYEKTDMGKIDSVLDRKLNKLYIKEYEVNFEE